MISVWLHMACSNSLSAYTEAVKELACEILEVMAEGLGVPDTWVFSRLIRDGESDSVLRLNHYPPIINREWCMEKDKDKDKSSQISKVGFGEHSDPQILTILRSNDVGGLQISLPDGVWIPVTPDPSAFYVNVGDVLQVRTYNVSMHVCFGVSLHNHSINYTLLIHFHYH